MSGALVGRVGLPDPEGWPGLEVGWFVDRSRWGEGFATEAGRAALDYALSVVGAEHVISVIRPANAASIRVTEELDERYERTVEIKGVEAAIYGVDRR